jgi:hypothetical protein
VPVDQMASAFRRATKVARLFNFAVLPVRATLKRWLNFFDV